VSRLARAVYVNLAVLAVAPAAVLAQTASDLAAFETFVLSPFGAVTPLARDYAGGLPPRDELSIRYGRWRYDINDVIHNDEAATFSVRVTPGTTVDLSGAYLALSCNCDPWLSTGVGVRTTLFSTPAGGADHRRMSAHVAALGTLGVARYTSTPAASSRAAQVALDLGVAVPAPWGTLLALSAFPGYAGGHLVSQDLTDGGRGRTIAAALAWSFPRGVTIDVGAQRFVLTGGPTEYGAALSWRRR